MKKIFKSITMRTAVALSLVVMMMVGFTVTASAAGNNTYKTIATNTNWKTVATSTNGFNCKVKIRCENTAVVRNDVKMLAQDGTTVVWQETGAIAFNGTRTFDCGSDVYIIQVKAQRSGGSAYASYAGEL